MRKNMARKIRAETKEIIPRYYGLSFQGEGNIRIFDNPSTAAIAYVALTPAYTSDGLASMLKDWQIQKRRELRGEAGYDPLFKLSTRQATKLLNCSPSELVELVRTAIQRNHGSYNLWKASGKEAVDNLILRGEVLTADVKSQREGTHKVILRGAIRGPQGQIKYTGARCDCDDNYWSETKGGQRITTLRKCLHIDGAETDSYLQDTRVQHPSRHLMGEKAPHEGQRSLTFNFVDDPFLKYLIIDVLIAREVLGKSAYETDRILMTPPIGPVITPLSLQNEVASARATIEIMKQKNRVREIDSDLLEAQKIIDEAFGRHLRNQGFEWKGYCLELGLPAIRYENGNVAVSLCFNSELPFYVVRNLQKSRVPGRGIFTQDFGPQEPLNQVLIRQARIDDRTRRITPFYVEPATRINVEEATALSLVKHLPTSVLSKYRARIANRTRLRRLGLQR